jgi:hypothetical protein
VSTAELARTAVRAAARVRAELGVGPADGICPFDIAEGLKVPVRLVALPSLEGMYSPDPKPTIVVSVERPAARRRYTCGHELGHHVFGHGTRLDELTDEATKSQSPYEFMAQRFAAALMMPKVAIDSAFADRHWSILHATPEMIFVVAQQLGVGFTTLLWHLERTLRQLPPSSAETLRRARLPQLRERIAGFHIEHDLLVVDRHWRRRTIDLEVGDVAIVPSGAEFDGDCASLETRIVRHLIAGKPGIGCLLMEGRHSPISVRVSRRAFTGIARYRHLKEISDDE